MLRYYSPGIYKPSPTTRLRAICDQLGYTEIRGEFSGGNDEGGLNHITAVRTDGTTFPVPHGYHEQLWNPKDWRPYPNPTPKTATDDLYDELWQLMEAPVSDEYGGFAGEFHVSGTYVYDRATNKITEQHTEYQHNADRYNDESLDF